MPKFVIIINFDISERLREYIVATYGANITSMSKGGGMTRIKAIAPDQQSLNAALQDIRDHLVEIEMLEP